MQIQLIKSEEELKKIFSKNLNKLMAEKDISAYDLDIETGISYQSIYTYTSGKGLPCTYYVYILARYFGCSIDELFKEEK